MKSLQFKMTCWIALAFFSLMFVLLVAFNIYAFHEVAHQEKRRMKTISRGILRELVGRGVHGAVSEQAIASINEKLSFIDKEGKLAYAIVSEDHRVLHHTPGFSIPLNEKFLAKEHKRLFLHSVKSGEDLDDLLAEWRFIFRYQGDGFIVFVSDYQNYELFERFMGGLAAVLVLALVLAVPCGFFLSRRILEPLSAIDATVQDIRAGDLRARIPAVASGDELSRLVETLNLTFDELEASFERIKQFSADAAHELNTPLTAMQGNLEVSLGRERTTLEYQTVLAECIEEISSMSRMVKDLLLLANPGNGRRKESFGRLDCSAVVEEASARLETIASKNSIRILRDIEPNVELEGDASLLSRLCHNLIHNAARFSPPDTDVTVALRRARAEVVLEVRDQGVGIKPQDRDRIFERFYQVAESRSAGAGLGLALVKWIADLHGARIEVESDPGRGSLFRITLPGER